MKIDCGNYAFISKAILRHAAFVLFVVCACLPIDVYHASAEESVCARVKIEIIQEATLERQGFDAQMRINNGMTDVSLENIAVTVHFADNTGAAVLASSDPDNTSALFFIRVDSMENINAIDGTGSVDPGSSAEIHWFIVPAPGAANDVPTGTMYMVGATITYTAAGEENTTVVAPDYIFVKPMPELTLDYFLPRWVYGDDAFTPDVVEPEIPFSLGVRVLNSGFGSAYDFKIGSAQPKIVENNQDLLFATRIIGSSVNDEPVTPSLAVDLGSIAVGAATVARWEMACSLSGEFVDFSAQYTHSDELGGELTSLITGVSTHLLIHDVRVDVVGRDSVRDFLVQEADDSIRVYESEGIDTVVTDQSALSSPLVSVTSSTYSLDIPSTAGFMYVQIDDPFDGAKEIVSVVRSDGKVIPLENVWFSKTRNGGETWFYFFNIFDANTTGAYRVVLRDSVANSHPPVLEPIPDYETVEAPDQPLSFNVMASDPDGTIPTLGILNRPAGATFEDRHDGTGVFLWSPIAGQAGQYEVIFTASDGQHTVSQSMTIVVFVAGDSDGDGFSDDEEIALGSDPNNGDSRPIETVVELARGFNLIGIPADTVLQPNMADWLPILGDSAEIEKVMVYNAALGTYVTLIPGSDENPVVSVPPGAGMIVYAKVEKSIAFTSRLCAAIDLSKGGNIVGFACPTDGYTAFDLLSALGSQNAISLQRYNRETGKFETAGFAADGQLHGEDFSIQPGEGYYVNMRQAVVGFVAN